MTPVAYAFNTAGIISLIIGVVLPNVVGYFTQASMNKGLKAGILAGLSALAGLLTQWADALNNHQHFAWQGAVLTAFATWLVAEGSYLRIWKPSGLSDKLQAWGPVHDDPTVTLPEVAAEYKSRHAESVARAKAIPAMPVGNDPGDSVSPEIPTRSTTDRPKPGPVA